jgi:hypothetical protein
MAQLLPAPCGFFVHSLPAYPASYKNTLISHRDLELVTVEEGSGEEMNSKLNILWSKNYAMQALC